MTEWCHRHYEMIVRRCWRAVVATSAEHPHVLDPGCSAGTLAGWIEGSTGERFRACEVRAALRLAAKRGWITELSRRPGCPRSWSFRRRQHPVTALMVVMPAERLASWSAAMRAAESDR